MCGCNVGVVVMWTGRKLLLCGVGGRLVVVVLFHRSVVVGVSKDKFEHEFR